MFKILITDKISKNGIKILQDAGFEVCERLNISEDEICSIIKDYHCIIVRSGTKVTKKIIDSSKSLKVIARAGAGVDNIDVETASLKGILVMNAEGNTISTAEHTIALLLAVAKKIPSAVSSLKSKKWERGKFMGNEIYGKTLGIIGFGKIGRVVAILAKGLKMNVLAYDPFVSEEEIRKNEVFPSSLEYLLQKSDFITVHTPLNNETRNLIGEKEIKLMKDGAYIINCARGGIIDEKALYSALISGKLSGAALDVYEKEPPGENPLLNLDNVVATPHIAASTYEAQERVALLIAEQLRDYFLEGKTTGAVNLKNIQK